MRRLLPCLAVPLLLVGSAARGAGLPPETAARLAAALDSLQSPAVAGYTLTVKVTVAKPNGSDREDHLEVMKATRAADGTLVHEVVRSLENGKDVTDGTGGFLWIKRTFHMDMEVAGVVAAPPTPAP